MNKNDKTRIVDLWCEYIELYKFWTTINSIKDRVSKTDLIGFLNDLTITNLSSVIRELINFYYHTNKEKYKEFYVIDGETKFITAAGGTQDKSFKDIISLLKCNFNSKISNTKVIPIGILDGFPLLNKQHYKNDFPELKEYVIVSSLLLRDFLYSLE